MELKLTIQMDNAAFHEFSNGQEVASILRKLAHTVDGQSLHDGWSRPLLDSYGNGVGKAEVTREEVDDDKFDDWMGQVDKEMDKACGLVHRDFPDQTWRDWYEDGMTPQEAAQEALENEGFSNDE